jgi:hypothetical protein
MTNRESLLAAGFSTSADGVLVAPDGTCVEIAQIGAFLELKLVLQSGIGFRAVVSTAGLRRYSESSAQAALSDLTGTDGNV